VDVAVDVGGVGVVVEVGEGDPEGGGVVAVSVGVGCVVVVADGDTVGVGEGAAVGDGDVVGGGDAPGTSVWAIGEAVGCAPSVSATGGLPMPTIAADQSMTILTKTNTFRVGESVAVMPEARTGGSLRGC
jgi:hypothetical protein